MSRRKVAARTIAAGAAVSAMILFGGAVGANAAITPVGATPAGAAAIASALTATGTTVTGASFETVPPTGTPNGTSDSKLANFPTDGQTFGIITNGDVNLADDPNNSASSGASDGGGAVRGDSDRDVSILKVDLNVPANANCLSFDFSFYSEEFPEFVGGNFNDAFIAEVDQSTWTTANGQISAPNNFAFDPSGNVISINSAGQTSLTAADAAGTTYDGGTALLKASKQVTPGQHSVYFSIFDQGDASYDSATFLDNLSASFVPNPAQQCRAGAVQQQYSLGLTPQTATNPVGTQHTVTAAVNEVAGGMNSPGSPAAAGPVTGGNVLFTVVGANPTTGTGAVANGQAQFTYTGTNPGTDTISACYDSNGNNQCDSGEATDTATKTWVGAPPPTTPTCATATPTITSNAAVVNGTPGNDVIFGGPANQQINGAGGNDVICGGAGNDAINGGDGNDYLDGQGGQDVVIGNAGDDTERGGDLADKVGGKTNDPGTDKLFGDAGVDQCFGTVPPDSSDPSCETTS